MSDGKVNFFQGSLQGRSKTRGCCTPAKQEGHHGVVIGKILEKYQPEKKAPTGKVYICPVCGFEHEGDINDEPEDYVCPLCGQPKSVFKEAK